MGCVNIGTDWESSTLWIGLSTFAVIVVGKSLWTGCRMLYWHQKLSRGFFFSRFYFQDSSFSILMRVSRFSSACWLFFFGSSRAQLLWSRWSFKFTRKDCWHAAWPPWRSRVHSWHGGLWWISWIWKPRSSGRIHGDCGRSLGSRVEDVFDSLLSFKTRKKRGVVT